MRFVRTRFDIAGKGFFCQKRALFEGSAYAHAHYHRRAGIGAGILNRSKNGVFNALHSVCRL